MYSIVKLLLYCYLCIIIVSTQEAETAETQRQTDKNTYDYIVVGLGMGGCVAAARLTESGARVLVCYILNIIPYPHVLLPLYSTSFPPPNTHL